jgi:hypothetical protein
MEDRETRRKIIRQWMSLPKDKRQTVEQAAAFAKKAVEENKLQHSRSDPYQRMMSWLYRALAGEQRRDESVH